MHDLHSLADQIRRKPGDRTTQLAYADSCAELGMANLAEKLRRQGQVVSLLKDGKNWKVCIYAAAPAPEGDYWSYTLAKTYRKTYTVKQEALDRAVEVAEQQQAPVDEFLVQGQLFWDESFHL